MCIKVKFYSFAFKSFFYLTTGATLAPQLNTELVSWARAERLREVDVRLISMIMMVSPQVAAITPTPDSCPLWVNIGER